jgi:hypothetical protein
MITFPITLFASSGGGLPIMAGLLHSEVPVDVAWDMLGEEQRLYGDNLTSVTKIEYVCKGVALSIDMTDSRVVSQDDYIIRYDWNPTLRDFANAASSPANFWGEAPVDVRLYYSATEYVQYDNRLYFVNNPGRSRFYALDLKASGTGYTIGFNRGGTQVWRGSNVNSTSATNVATGGASSTAYGATSPFSATNGNFFFMTHDGGQMVQDGSSYILPMQPECSASRYWTHHTWRYDPQYIMILALYDGTSGNIRYHDGTTVNFNLNAGQIFSENRSTSITTYKYTQVESNYPVIAAGSSSTGDAQLQWGDYRYWYGTSGGTGGVGGTLSNSFTAYYSNATTQSGSYASGDGVQLDNSASNYAGDGALVVGTSNGRMSVRAYADGNGGDSTNYMPTYAMAYQHNAVDMPTSWNGELVLTSAYNTRFQIRDPSGNVVQEDYILSTGAGTTSSGGLNGGVYKTRLDSATLTYGDGYKIYTNHPTAVTIELGSEEFNLVGTKPNGSFWGVFYQGSTALFVADADHHFGKYGTNNNDIEDIRKDWSYLRPGGGARPVAKAYNGAEFIEHPTWGPVWKIDNASNIGYNAGGTSPSNTELFVLQDADLPRGTADFTIAVWAHTNNSTHNQYGAFFDLGEVAGSQRMCDVETYSSQRIRFLCRNDSGTIHDFYGGRDTGNGDTTYVKLNEWNHYMVTRYNGTLYCFINGVMVAKSSTTGLTNSELPISFGGRLMWNSQPDGSTWNITQSHIDNELAGNTSLATNYYIAEVYYKKINIFNYGLDPYDEAMGLYRADRARMARLTSNSKSNLLQEFEFDINDAT